MGAEKDEAKQYYLDWALENLRNTNDDDELYDFINIFFQIDIPRIPVIEGNCSPFDFVADTFFERELDTLCMGNRTGGKTLNYGLKNALDGLFKGCEIASIGAIVSQAEKQYSYTQSFLSKPLISQYLKQSIMKHTVVETPQNGKSLIQILPGTMNGVNSPHPQKANVDEIELMDWKILQEAMSMPCSNDNARASLCLTSSRKFSYGNMEKLLEESKKRQLKIYRWGIWETIEPCPDSRSGTYPCIYSFAPYGQNEVISINVLTKNENLANKNITPDVIRLHPETASGCLGCPLLEVCQTKAKASRGFYRIDDAIKKFYMMDRETWDSQWESLKPMTTGLIYKQFNEFQHVLRGESQWKYNPNYECHASLDAGFEHPAILSFYQEDTAGKIYKFHEIVKQHTTSHDLVTNYWVPKLKELGFCNNPRRTVIYDPSAKDESEQLKQHGIKMVPANNEVDAGIKSVRAYLKSAGGLIRYFVNECCVNTIKEYQTYHYKPETEIVDKIEDDCMDTDRYYIHTKHPLAPAKKTFAAKIVG